MQPFRLAVSRTDKLPLNLKVFVWDAGFNPVPKQAVITETSWEGVTLTFESGEVEFIDKQAAKSLVMADATHPLAADAVTFMHLLHYLGHFEMIDNVLWDTPELSRDLLAVFEKHKFGEKIKGSTRVLGILGSLPEASSLLSLADSFVDEKNLNYSKSLCNSDTILTL